MENRLCLLPSCSQLGHLWATPDVSRRYAERDYVFNLVLHHGNVACMDSPRPWQFLNFDQSETVLRATVTELCHPYDHRMSKIVLQVEHPQYWAIQLSWFARVNALCNLSRKKSREVISHFRADF